ncbi:hypothetical protein [Chondrinema litorale]|uniref:hypothetical protein n=1 Tax=Chondrinema litorale TaxID=2994555 RepID=UPI0025436CBF|nr:hypothetical protein [Chondrinema litorale]UZR97020.1 hypothetical protein OQ292_23260 [Chondrinema litorale]
MRKIFSIVFLCSFLFYQMGHFAVSWLMEGYSDVVWTYKIEKNLIEKKEFIEYAIPFSTPYQLDRPDFYQTNTEIEIDNEYYRIIKQRYARDTLFVVFVKDTIKNKVDESVKEWQTFTAESNSSSQKGKEFIRFLISPKPFLPVDFIKIELNAAILADGKNKGFLINHFSGLTLEIPVPPPESTSLS